MDFITTSQQIKSAIQQAKHVLVIGHQQPDADAIGSMVAVGQLLDFFGVSHIKFCVDQPPENIRWINNFEPVVSNLEQLAEENFDLVIVVDSGDLKRAGVDQVIPQLAGTPSVINIDHHFTNDRFGSINLVEATEVSTTAILYRVFKTLKVAISPKTASAMLAGIIFDTYNFTNPNTNDSALNIASSLLSAGASLPNISNSILKNKKIEALKVWGEILMRLSYNPEFNIATTVVLASDLKSGLASTEVSEGVANFLNNLSGVSAALILQEQEDGMIKGSFRTNDDSVDVSALAQLFGGGGHKKAAGFKIKGMLVKTPTGWQVQ